MIKIGRILGFLLSTTHYRFMSAMATQELYTKTAVKLREINTLNSINGLLGWDEMVMLPPESSDLRSKQKSVLSGIIYDKSTDNDLGDSLKELNDHKSSLNAVQSAVIRDSLKQYIISKALPKSLVTRAAELETEAYNAWVNARKLSNFALFSPVLKEWVDLNIAKANHIDPSKKPYDVHLDMYEKGIR